MRRNLKIARLRMGVHAAIGAMAITAAGEAHAQTSSSNCMAMGGGMVHCDTVSTGDGGYALGEAIGTMIMGAKEKSL
ncbi:MAG: hypothetical protein P0Y64_06090 [Candidatus Sphingomonas colombiensis]|nr:hypothetical protein [Sphingomonas sp.]WEK44373.1 MAG: hypothetical protein P0Y64_06090 [Sphingomonas sp.]